MDAFDSDVLIFAAKGDDRGDGAMRALRDGESDAMGSLLLVVELLSHPIQSDNEREGDRLRRLLGRLELRPVDRSVAYLATEFRAKYRLKTADAIHLATAVHWGASRFHTNNSKGFGGRIEEIEVVLASR